MKMKNVKADSVAVLSMKNDSIAVFITSTLFGYIIAGASIFGGLSPFGISLVAAAAQSSLFGSVVGVLLGYVIPLTGGMQYKYLFALGMATLFKVLLGGEKDTRRAALQSVTAFCCLFIPAVIFNSLGDFSFYSILLTLSESLLAASGAYFIGSAVDSVVVKGRSMGTMSRMETYSGVITLAIFFMALCGVRLGIISLGRIFCCVAVVLFSYALKEAGGAIAGIVAGGITAAVNPELIPFMAAYSFSGMISGLFGRISKVLCALSFALVGSMMALLVGGEGILPIVLEIAAGSALFMLIPAKYLAAFEKSTDYQGTSEASLKTVVENKLSVISEVLADVADTISSVAKHFAPPVMTDISQIYDHASDRVCKRCGLKMYCYDTAYNDTAGTFNDFTSVLKKNGRVEKEDVPAYFKERCCKVGELTAQINSNYAEYLTASKLQMKSEQAREMVTDHLRGMSRLFCDLSAEVDKIKTSDASTIRIAKRYFDSRGVRVKRVDCVVDEFGRLTLNCELYSLDGISVKTVASDLSALCGRYFDTPAMMHNRDSILLSLFEKACLKCDMDTYQIPYGDNKYCGDACNAFVDDKGNAYAILSDGMGSGSKAAVDGHMACSLLSRLIKAGFSFEAAIGIVNASLITKPGEESLSTLDAVKIDLYTGKGRLLKAGAAPTFIRRNGKVMTVETGSLPVGIIGDIAFEEKTLTFKPGDVVLMVSDGVSQLGNEWIELEMAANSLDSPLELAKQVALSAKKQLERIGHDDDITAAAIFVSKGI